MGNTFINTQVWLAEVKSEGKIANTGQMRTGRKCQGNEAWPHTRPETDPSLLSPQPDPWPIGGRQSEAQNQTPGQVDQVHLPFQGQERPDTPSAEPPPQGKQMVRGLRRTGCLGAQLCKWDEEGSRE